MQPAGLRQVELAKADGRWDMAYKSQSKITIPDDFQSELDKNQKAKEFFSTLNSVNRYAILFRIQTAKKVFYEAWLSEGVSSCSFGQWGRSIRSARPCPSSVTSTTP